MRLLRVTVQAFPNGKSELVEHDITADPRPNDQVADELFREGLTTPDTIRQAVRYFPAGAVKVVSIQTLPDPIPGQ